MKKASKAASDPNISSAEMTAYWRSKYPQLSGDKLSIELASKDGIAKSLEFEEKYDYPLVARKVSVRAGFFLKQAVDLLLTGKFDSCISFASGFSLLSYYIAMAVQDILPTVSVVDTDLPHIIEEREARLKKIAEKLDKDILSKVQATVVDLEKACKEGKTFRELFPECQAPVFLIEGVVYFLSQECVDWMFREISQYPNAAVIMDYWPEDGVKRSRCFNKVVQSLKGFIPENIKSFWDDKSLAGLYAMFHSVRDVPIQHVEHQYSRFVDESPEFLDQNTFFPVQLFVAEREEGVKRSEPQTRFVAKL